MRAAFIAFALLAAAPFARADDVLGPADYIKIMADSKLRYNVLSEPSKTPVAPMRCPRRDETTRVVTKGKDKKLEAWVVKPEALKLFREGEVLYQANDLAGAAEKYKAGLAADPEASAGHYFYGDTLLFGAKDPAAALAEYEKGLALDPTMPSGHFFASSALVQLHRPDDAREQIIKALTYYPGYESIWKVLPGSADRWNMKPPVRHKFEPPAGYVGMRGENGVDIYGGEGGAWLGYAMCKAVWANEPKFKKQHVEGGWSLDEERACVLNQLQARYNQTEAALKNAKENEVIAALPPLERHLFDVAQAHLLDGYILFEIIGQNCPLSLSILGDDSIKQLDGYIRAYVIVAQTNN